MENRDNPSIPKTRKRSNATNKLQTDKLIELHPKQNARSNVSLTFQRISKKQQYNTERTIRISRKPLHTTSNPSNN